MHGRVPCTRVDLQKRACRWAWPLQGPDGSTCKDGKLKSLITATYSALYTVHCILYTALYTALYTVHSALYTV